ncbi:AMP-dependent synthetase/ligase [Martelella sp. FOR1707]
METPTVAKLFAKACRERGHKTAFRAKVHGIWHSVSWEDYGRNARSAGLGLAALGVKRGDTVSIIADPAPEWVYVDHGAMGMGAVSNGIYTTDSPDQIQYILTDSRTVVCVVQNEEQLDKILSVRDRCPDLKTIVVLDMEGLRDFSDPMVMSFEALQTLGSAQRELDWDAMLEAGKAADIVMLIYTSGTTGPAKGVMLSNRNLISAIDTGTRALGFRDGEEQISFLPLCHIAERSWTVLFPLATEQIVNFAEQPSTVLQNIREVRPTAFFAVPRFWEKFHSDIQLKVKQATWFNRKSYEAALAIGERRADYVIKGRHVPFHIRLLFALVDLFVLGNVKRMIGIDRCRFLVTGAAPIAPDLIRWYFALGKPMLELYGMTETSGIATAPPAGEYRLGSVGKSVSSNEIRLGDQGEIQIRGPNVFEGYLNKPDQTRETIVDGWLHTGDVGRIEDDGWVYITDRLKDLIITAGGKNITPSEIENQLKFSPYIADAIIIGDRRPYLSCLILLDQENVSQYALDRGYAFTDYPSLCRIPEIRQLISTEVDAVNARFSRVENIRKFSLIEQQLSAEDEEITPTMKMKRKLVERKYSSVIERMYVTMES